MQRFIRSAPGMLCAGLLAVLGAACSGPSGEPLPAQAQPLGESGLWVSAPQLRLMPAMAMGAAYFTVHNRSERDDRLLAVSVETADGPPVEASLHETTLVDGVSRMRSRAEGFPLPAGADLELVRGGAHVMLSGELPEAADDAQATLTLTLRFEHAGVHSVIVPTDVS